VSTRRDIQAAKYFAWDDAKNAKLRKERGIGFEDVVCHIEHGDLFDILEHANPERYGGQRIFVIDATTTCSADHPLAGRRLSQPRRDGEKAKAEGDARVTVYLGATSTAAHKEHHAGQVKGGLRRDPRAGQ
jgi:hypothetical protein